MQKGDRQNRTGRTGQTAGLGRKGQAELDRQNAIVRKDRQTGHAELNS
jgi:hypothetical protein